MPEKTEKRHQRTWVIASDIALLLATAALRPIATWQVRNGSAQVATFVLDSDIPDNFATDVVWNCDTYVATIRVPNDLNHYQFVELLGERFTSIGFKRSTRYAYQRDRTDMLDFDMLAIDRPAAENTRVATVRMTVFDTDSSFCIPRLLAPTSERPPATHEATGCGAFLARPAAC